MVKSNDHMFFDLKSDDIWMHVIIEIPDKDYVIKLECKAHNELRVY